MLHGAWGRRGDRRLRVSKFVVLLAVTVSLAACGSPQVAPTIAEPPRSSGYAHGIDMAADSSDVAAELQGRPWLQFVARYYRDPSSRFPALTPDEARRLSALGVKIVTVWEWHSSTPSYFTYASGYNDALNAVRQAKSVGQPSGSAIYFAVDFNAKGAALYQIDQYFRGANAGMAAAGGGRPPYRIGVYGSGAVCMSVKGARLAQYAWLSGSASWEGTAGYGDWNIRQAPAAQRFANLSFSHDANEARSDYGGFRLGEYANAETPAAAVVTAAAAAPAAAANAVATAVTAIAPPPTSPPPPPPQAPPPPAPLSPPAALAAAAPVTAAPGALAASMPLPAIANAPPPVRPSASAAEVAALAAEEPAAPAHASASRASKELASREERREQEPAHAERRSAATKRKAYTVAVNNRAVAEPGRRPHGAAVAEGHERAHKVSEPRRSEEHGAHTQAAKARPVHAVEHPPRHNTEQRKPRHVAG